MKHLVQFLAFGLSIICITSASGDSTDGSPYDNVQSGKLDATQPMLSIVIKPHSGKTALNIEKLLLTLYNDTQGNIYVLEQHPFVDFTFEVKDSSGLLKAPTHELDKPKQNRDAWLHISRALEPGQFTHYTIDLSKIYDLQTGQTYTVQAWRYVNAQEFGSGEKVASNIIQFTVSQ